MKISSIPYSPSFNKSEIVNFGVFELKTKLLSGVKKLNDSVSSTLGPAGRTVLIKGEYGQLTVTKDGVSVAKAFKELE